MNLHEYQGKSILETFGIKVPKGLVVESIPKAIKAAKSIGKETNRNSYVIKAQVHSGGRGKAGGIKVAKSLEEVELYAKTILGANLITPQTGPNGKAVHQIMIAEDVYYKGASEPKEYYVCILLDRKSKQHMIMYCAEGGIDIEEVAEKNPEKIFYQHIDPILGLMPFQTRQIAFDLNIPKEAFHEMTHFLKSLYKAYINSDATFIEINPTFKTSDNQIMAVDAKMTLDNNALFRHPNYKAMQDTREEHPTDVKAKAEGLNYISLDGNIGCMVNGAGLAMATMDLIKQAGGAPANFLDVGGSTDSKRVEQGFRIITKDPKVKAILINIFGGIVRCDRVAQGVVDACKSMGTELKVPVIIRLQGTNAEIAKDTIDSSGLKVFSAIGFQEAAEKVREVLTE